MRAISEQARIQISEVLPYCTFPRKYGLTKDSRMKLEVYKFNLKTPGLTRHQSKTPSCDFREMRLTNRVNVADAMQFWTSKKLKSTTHRVQIPPRQRYSIAYFVQPDPDTVTSPSDEAYTSR